MDQDETTDINMRLFGLDPEAIGDIVLRALDDSSQPKDMQHIADPDDKYLHSRHGRGLVLYTVRYPHVSASSQNASYAPTPRRCSNPCEGPVAAPIAARPASAPLHPAAAQTRARGAVAGLAAFGAAHPPPGVRRCALRLENGAPVGCSFFFFGPQHQVPQGNLIFSFGD